MARSLAACLFVLLISPVDIAAQVPESGAPVPPRTVWDGVYSVAQAERGGEAYTNHCAGCHRDDLSGYDGLLRGRRFMEKFREASLHLLFDKTKTTMPRGAAGSLSDAMYVDIVSHVLRMNDFPSGDRELTLEDVPAVKLVGKGGAEPVPNFSLVRVVGCLGRKENAWILSNATEPVRTGNPQPAPEERSAASPALSGISTFGLMVSAAYSPADHADRIVEVRGLLIRQPSGNRLNVTSLETVGPPCTPE
jgi:mono/diheme cytochrome c family protein